MKRSKVRDTRVCAPFVIGMLFIPMLYFLVFWVFVNFDTIILSFQRFDIDKKDYYFCGWTNYKQIFREFAASDGLIKTAFVNSFLIFLWNDVVLLFTSLFFAYVLHRGMKGAQAFRVIFFIPSIISAVVLTMVFGFMFDTNVGLFPELLRALELKSWIPKTGFLAGKTAFPMLLIYGLWSGIGNNVVLLNGAIKRIPPEIFEAAALDGIGFVKEFTHIVIPLIGGTLSTLILMGVTLITGYFLQPMLLMPNSTEVYTLGLYIVSKVNGQTNMGIAAATGNLCVLLAVPIVLLVKTVAGKIFPVYEY